MIDAGCITLDLLPQYQWMNRTHRIIAANIL